MDGYQCLKLFYSHGRHPSLPPITGGINRYPPLWGSWGVSNTSYDAPPPSDAKVLFFDNLMKKLDSGWSSQNKIFGFLYLYLKLSLSPPTPKGKMLWSSHFRSFIKSAIFSQMGNFITKLNFVSTPWKIIIPPENSVGDYIRVIEIHLGV